MSRSRPDLGTVNPGAIQVNRHLQVTNHLR